jgi:hypothetical protein
VALLIVGGPLVGGGEVLHRPLEVGSGGAGVVGRRIHVGGILGGDHGVTPVLSQEAIRPAGPEVGLVEHVVRRPHLGEAGDGRLGDEPGLVECGEPASESLLDMSGVDVDRISPGAGLASREDLAADEGQILGQGAEVDGDGPLGAVDEPRLGGRRRQEFILHRPRVGDVAPCGQRRSW